MGARDYSSLPKDSILARWNSNWFARWEWHTREIGQEQAKANHIGAGWEAGQGIEGSQVCGMLCINTGMFFDIFN